MNRTVLFEGVEIQYEWFQKKVKRLNLRVHSDGTVAVSSPKLIPGDEVDRFVLLHAKQILKSQARFLLKHCEHTPNPCPEEGSIIWILGEKKSVRLRPSNHNEVILHEQELILYLKDPSNPSLRAKILASFLEKICHQEIEAIFKKQYNALFKDESYPIIRYRKMKARWGSCYPTKRVLTFNKGLAHVPMECIEYVVCHELTHLIQSNHSARFYHELSLQLPDWKERQDKLFLFDPLLRY